MLVDFVCHTSHVISLTEVISQKFSIWLFNLFPFRHMATWRYLLPSPILLWWNWKMSVTVMVKVKKQTVCRGGFNVERLREKEWEDRLFYSICYLSDVPWRVGSKRHLMGFPSASLHNNNCRFDKEGDRQDSRCIFLMVSNYISHHLKSNRKDGGGFTGPKQTSNKVWEPEREILC